MEPPSENLQLGTACISDDHNLTFSSLKQQTTEAFDAFTGFACTVVDYKCIPVSLIHIKES